MNVKKLLLFLLTIFALTACSEESQKPVDEKAPENEKSNSEVQLETVKVKFDKPFDVKRVPASGMEYTTAKVTVSNYQLVQNMSSEAEDNEKYDFVKLDVVFENVGDFESSQTAVENPSFSFYDESGLKINVDFMAAGDVESATYKFGNVRPGGKNQGTLYLPIPKGSVPAEMVYKPNWISIIGSNEYVFKL
jgi:hypothetical protein